MACGQSQSTSALPNLSPRSNPIFCAAPLKYWDTTSSVIWSPCQLWRTGRLDRYGTGTGEKPSRIHPIAASSGVMLVKLEQKSTAVARASSHISDLYRLFVGLWDSAKARAVSARRQRPNLKGE